MKHKLFFYMCVWSGLVISASLGVLLAIHLDFIALTADKVFVMSLFSAFAVVMAGGIPVWLMHRYFSDTTKMRDTLLSCGFAHIDKFGLYLESNEDCWMLVEEVLQENERLRRDVERLLFVDRYCNHLVQSLPGYVVMICQGVRIETCNNNFCELTIGSHDDVVNRRLDKVGLIEFRKMLQIPDIEFELDSIGMSQFDLIMTRQGEPVMVRWVVKRIKHLEDSSHALLILGMNITDIASDSSNQLEIKNTKT